jgi:hypothetical protein
MPWVRRLLNLVHSGFRKPVDSDEALRDAEAERLARQERNIKTGLPPEQFQDRPRR